MSDKPFSYDRVAATYARHRAASDHVLDELRRGARLHSEARVLEVGCGTGNQIGALVAVTGWQGVGIEPAWAMVKQAAPGAAAAFVQGAGERLPFAAGSFDLLFSVNVIHHLGESAAYFRAARHVLRPGGQICTATDSAAMIGRRQPLAAYWPETVAIDLARYPAVERLAQEMAAAGFREIEVREISRPFPVTDSAPYRERAFSCLHLISPVPFRRGLRRLEADLAQGPLPGRSEFACLWGRV